MRESSLAVLVLRYQTFIAATGKGGVDAVYADENIWLSQKMLAELYQVSVSAINQRLKRIFDDSELQAGSVIKDFLITAADGKNYKTKHYNLQAIIVVGYKVNSERAVQFRKWATGILESYTIKGLPYIHPSLAFAQFANHGGVFKAFVMEDAEHFGGGFGGAGYEQAAGSLRVAQQGLQGVVYAGGEVDGCAVGSPVAA